jgi:hypothetical protein
MVPLAAQVLSNLNNPCDIQEKLFSSFAALIALLLAGDDYHDN